MTTDLFEFIFECNFCKKVVMIMNHDGNTKVIDNMSIIICSDCQKNKLSIT